MVNLSSLPGADLKFQFNCVSQSLVTAGTRRQSWSSLPKLCHFFFVEIVILPTLHPGMPRSSATAEIARVCGQRTPQDRSRSSILIPNESPCTTSLANSDNLCPISHSFQVIVQYSSDFRFQRTVTSF